MLSQQTLDHEVLGFIGDCLPDFEKRCAFAEEAVEITRDNQIELWEHFERLGHTALLAEFIDDEVASINSQKVDIARLKGDLDILNSLFLESQAVPAEDPVEIQLTA